jgi:hypothetical protein
MPVVVLMRVCKDVEMLSGVRVFVRVGAAVLIRMAVQMPVPGCLQFACEV